jgi:hypothetical protein
MIITQGVNECLTFNNSIHFNKKPSTAIVRECHFELREAISGEHMSFITLDYSFQATPNTLSPCIIVSYSLAASV